MRAIGKNVVVELKEEPYTQRGSIIVAEIGRKDSGKGVVVCVGPECKQLKEGDWVIFPVYRAMRFEIDAREFYILPEDAVGVILE